MNCELDLYVPTSDNPEIHSAVQFLSKHTTHNRLLLQYLYYFLLVAALARRKLDRLHCREPSLDYMDL